MDYQYSGLILGRLSIPLVAALLLALLLGSPLTADEDTLITKKAAKPSSSVSDGIAFIKGRERVLEGNYEEAVPFLEQALKEDPGSAFISHQLSEVHYHLNNLDRAEMFAVQAVEKEPKNIDFRATLGGIYASEKKYPQAKEQYSKIMEIEPENQRAPLLLGILEAESGNLENAQQTLSQTIEKNPENYMGYFYRAKIFLEMEDIKRAKADLDKCLTLRPSFVEAGTALGMLEERLGDTDAAIAVYNRIQGSGRFKKRLAQLYLQKNEFDKALEELLEYEKMEPDDYTVRVKIALIYYELKQYETAQKNLQEILKEQPQADNVRFYLGAILEELKKYGSAIAEFKKVSADSTFYKEAMVHTGYIYKEQNKLREGLDFARKLRLKHLEIIDFYDLEASFHQQLKDYKKALSVITDGLKRFPKEEKLLYFEGALHDKMGERNKAIGAMKQIIEANPNNAHALNFLGYTYAEMGEHLDEAEKLVSKALSLRPNDGYIEDSLGWVYFKKGKLDEAQKTLEKAAASQPDEPIILEHLGDVCFSRKESNRAVEYYRKAVSLAQKDKEMLRKLETKIANMQSDKKPSSTDEKN